MASNAMLAAVRIVSAVVKENFLNLLILK